MDKQKIAKELVGMARELISMNDDEFIADQLNNAWEHMSEREMLEWLESETTYSGRVLKKLVDKWYDDVSLRMKMDLASTSEWKRWLRSELR